MGCDDMKKLQSPNLLLFWGQVFSIYAWLTVLSPLSGTDCYYSVYLLCGILGLLCLTFNHRQEMGCVRDGSQPRRCLLLCSSLYSCAVLLANYTLFEPFSSLQNLWNLAWCFAGGTSVAYQILQMLVCKVPFFAEERERKHSLKVFTAVFAMVALVDLGYLFFALYPGVLTRDAISTMAQILGVQEYNNVMPYWHTVTVQILIELGLRCFGDINAAIALFHCGQILFMAACMGLVVMTLYQIGVPRAMLILISVCYAFLPHNIVYSVTLWKDIPFSGAAVLMITGLYRLMKPVGTRRWFNYLVFILGAVGFSLWRTNGWYAFLVTVLVMLVLVRKRYGKLLVIMTMVLLMCWLLINPVLDALAVKETDFVEAFAVPMQQVARVIANGRELSQTQYALLEEIFVLEQVPLKYNPQTVDPIKFETFRYEKVGYILENWDQYLKLYFDLALRYPGEYLKAWVEETKGYWNGGYRYWIYTLQMQENAFGIFQTRGNSIVARAYGALLRLAERQEILQFTTSIGLHVWGLVACCVVNVLKKREEYLLTVPLLVLVAGLWLGAPVFAEFRYAYPVFLSMPLLVGVTCFAPARDEK